ncbi:MAG: TIGR03905 family TSCPD domain-containing protein [Eubacterium sp.]|nr:TIGR03905 family TSCPD domain-containing protein [Eubacterium sp.]
MQYQYKTTGTCAQMIQFEIDDNGLIQDVQFMGGCNGNLKGISRLVKGRKASEVAELLKGTTCGPKPTSCPDQFARALEAAMAQA